MGTRHILITMGIILILSGLIFGGFFGRKRGIGLFSILLGLIFLVVPLAGLYGYAALRPGEVSVSTSPARALGMAYEYAFKPPIDDDTYFFKESDYYTIKLKRSTKGNSGNPLESLVLDHLVHSYTDLNDPSYLEYE